jgi:hypothetical protein
VADDGDWDEPPRRRLFSASSLASSFKTMPARELILLLMRASLLIVFLFSCLCSAEVIRDQPGAYEFVFPQGWSFDPTQKKFTVIGPNRAELSEISPPPGAASLDVATTTVIGAWLAVGGKSTGQTFDLSGKKWRGRAVVLQSPSQQDRASSQILIIFVAKSGKQFRQFSFSIPNDEWKNSSQQYLAILRSMRFPASGRP